jgi:hypothetical protein
MAVSARAEERVLFDFEPAEFSWEGPADQIKVSRAAVLEPSRKRAHLRDQPWMSPPRPAPS